MNGKVHSKVARLGNGVPAVDPVRMVRLLEDVREHKALLLAAPGIIPALTGSANRASLKTTVLPFGRPTVTG